MECRLGEPSLSEPERVFAGQQAIAKAVPEAIVKRALVVVARVILQHVLDVRGIRKEKPVIGPGFQMNDVAKPIGSIEKRGDRVGTELRQHPENWITSRSGRVGDTIWTSCRGHVSTIIGAG